MIVDDSAKVRALIKYALSADCDSIIECADGADALKMYKAHRPDLVLMDVQMPRLDGLAATRVLIEYDPTARIHILTDYGEDVLGTAAKAAGACGYTSKISLHDLNVIVSRYAASR